MTMPTVPCRACGEPLISVDGCVVLREDGWTCEYHEPTSAQGECEQCDRAHDATARRIATMAIPTRPADKMNPMTQEPDPTIEVVVLKKKSPLPDASGYTLAQRGLDTDDEQDYWYTIDWQLCTTWSELEQEYLGWWPFDYRLMVNQ